MIALREKTILIAGGGPAGMMAAISAASSSAKVILLEKNDSLGKKLLLTGGGRCNLTNMCDEEDLIGHFSKTGDFLRDAFKVFGNKELVKFFAERGLKTKIEDGGKVFPEAGKASSVLDVLRKELDRLKVKILFNKSIKGVILEEGSFKAVTCSDGSVIAAESLVIATGGLSYSSTGSSGDGIRIARKLGHRIVPVRPGLVSLDLEGKYPKALEGLSLDEVKLTFTAGNSKVRSEKGSMLFTSTGISGPAVLSSSAKAVDWINEGKKVSLKIDIMPSASIKEAEDVLSREVLEFSGKSIRNILKSLVPLRLADIFLEITNIRPDKKAKELTLEEKKHLAELFKALKFNVSGGGSFEKAQITRGGVSVKDINPRTMASKRVKGLYFAGEMIDVDGDCGGFNLQAAFSSGYLSGRSAAS